MRHVVDVSHYQDPGAIDWAAIKAAGVSAVMVKVSQGLNYVDPRASEHVKNASDAGLLVGAYHFMDPNSDGSGQGAHFVQTLKDIADELGSTIQGLFAKQFWIDVEMTPGWADVDAATRMKRLCHLIIAAEAEVGRVGIYTGKPFWDEMFGGSAGIASEIGVNLSVRALWIAAYHDPSIPPRLPSPWSDWAMWQFTDKGIGNLDTSLAKW